MEAWHAQDGLFHMKAQSIHKLITDLFKRDTHLLVTLFCQRKTEKTTPKIPIKYIITGKAITKPSEFSSNSESGLIPQLKNPNECGESIYRFIHSLRTRVKHTF